MMRELTISEIKQVDGAVTQSDAINTNLTIAAIGAAAIFAGFTAPAWGAVALMGLSVAVTGTYIYEQLR